MSATPRNRTGRPLDRVSWLLLFGCALAPVAGAAVVAAGYRHTDPLLGLMSAMSVPALAAAALIGRGPHHCLAVAVTAAAGLAPAGYEGWVCATEIGNAHSAVPALVVLAVFVLPVAFYLAVNPRPVGVPERAHHPVLQQVLLGLAAGGPLAGWALLAAAHAHGSTATNSGLLGPQAAWWAGVGMGVMTVPGAVAAVVAVRRGTVSTWRVAVRTVWLAAAAAALPVVANLAGAVAAQAAQVGGSPAQVVSLLGALAALFVAHLALAVASRVTRTRVSAADPGAPAVITLEPVAASS